MDQVWLVGMPVTAHCTIAQFSDAACRHAASLLPPDEHSYVQQGLTPAVQRERLLSRALLRSVRTMRASEDHTASVQVLCQYIDTGAVPPPAVRFTTNRYGKPFIALSHSSSPPSSTNPVPRLHFNLTHTTSLVGLAVARGPLVGIDAERRARKLAGNPLKVAARRLTEAEQAYIQVRTSLITLISVHDERSAMSFQR